MLETQRLLLRQFTLADVNHYHRQLLGDPDVMKTLPPGKPRSREQTKAALNPRIEHWENHGFGLWAVIYKQNGEFIGHCGLQYLEDFRGRQAPYKACCIRVIAINPR